MCTSIRFTDNSGHMYLGRNLDWSFDYGQQVRVMPRGFHIPYSFIDDATAAYAVIGMCIDYKNYPMFFDCGNDAGLAVAGLNFPGYAEYAEDPVDGKTNIAAFEFPLWVAATFSTVDEVEAALRDTVIVAKSAGEGLGVSLLHWIIGDSQRSIVVEMMADGLLEEARKVYPFRHLNSLNTVGYKELFNYFDGEWPLDLAVEKIRRNSRVYARKQMTWFKRDEEIKWFHPDEETEILRYLDGIIKNQ